MGCSTIMRKPRPLGYLQGELVHPLRRGVAWMCTADPVFFNEASAVAACESPRHRTRVSGDAAGFFRPALWDPDMTGGGIGHVLVVGTGDPWASTTGGTVRTRALVDAIRATGAEVTLVHPAAGEVGRGRARGFTKFVATTGFATLGRVKREFLPLPTMAGTRDRTMSGLIEDLRSSADLMIATTLSTAPYWRRIEQRSVVDGVQRPLERKLLPGRRSTGAALAECRRLCSRGTSIVTNSSTTLPRLS